MIAVIADDFSGAAELAGIGFCAGLSVEVQTEFCSDSRAGLLVLDTDSRSCGPSEAARRVHAAAEPLKQSALPLDWLYKKTDSVLRGPIAAELSELMNTFEIPHVLLVPANPSKGRIIRQGHYFVNHQPLHQTDFAKDPEYPAFSSDVLELLGLSSSDNAGVLKPRQALPSGGIWVGEAESSQDIRLWAERADSETLPAGAADFFTAILQTKGFQTDRLPPLPERPSGRAALFVFGSGSAYSRQILQQARRQGHTVYRMPEELFSSAGRLELHEPAVRLWADQIGAALEKEPCVLAAIDRPLVSDPSTARFLSAVTAEMVRQVFSRSPLKDLYLEGGATGSAVVRRLGWKRFLVTAQPAPGVVQMRPAEKADCSITVKPGSYPWPELILNLFLKGASCADGHSSLD